MRSTCSFTFTPHLLPMFRGILSTIYVDIKKEKTISNLQKELVKFYKKLNISFVTKKKIGNAVKRDKKS